jgi:tRNA(Met) cytidine acetyltransferase
MRLQQLGQLLQQAAAQRVRLPVWLQGEPAALLHLANQLLAQFAPERCWWLGSEAPEQCTALKQAKAHQLLGTECDWLVINACSGFNGDQIAAASGALKAGGLWLLLTPPTDSWLAQPNPDHQPLLSYPLTPPAGAQGFTAFWLKTLQQANLLHAQLAADGEIKILQQPIFPPLAVSAECQPPFKTAGQQTAVSAIIKVVTGHRRRPLALTADRGCGKSAALGLAAAQLAKQGKQRILITAPSQLQASVALAHFASQVQQAQQNALQFIAIDQLLVEQPAADLVLVDEAAALPAPQLQQLVNHYSRLVFASTEHGYEGTGRGFQLRFQPYLAQQCPGWRQLRLTEPIRYQLQDPLEQLIRCSFLLKMELPEPQYDITQPLSLKYYQHHDWLAESEKLQQVFALLSFAHYQTQIKDLLALLENAALTVYTLEQDNQLLGCVLISSEGELSAELAEQIYKGKRRVQGHLLAQSLAFHLAKPELASLKLARIMRIAIAPNLQQRGLGSQLIQLVSRELSDRGYQYLGSSFGATPALLGFWQRNSFQPIRLGHQLDKASAEPSLLVCKNLQGAAETINALSLAFSQQLYLEVTEYPSNLEPALLLALIKPSQRLLNSDEQDQLNLFANGQRPYELVATLLVYWFNQYRLRLDPQTAAMFIARCWQKQSWSAIAQRFQLPGKAAIIKLMQQSVSKQQ